MLADGGSNTKTYLDKNHLDVGLFGETNVGEQIASRSTTIA